MRTYGLSKKKILCKYLFWFTFFFFFFLCDFEWLLVICFVLLKNKSTGHWKNKSKVKKKELCPCGTDKKRHSNMNIQRYSWRELLHIHVTCDVYLWIFNVVSDVYSWIFNVICDVYCWIIMLPVSCTREYWCYPWRVGMNIHVTIMHTHEYSCYKCHAYSRIFMLQVSCILTNIHVTSVMHTHEYSTLSVTWLMHI